MSGFDFNRLQIFQGLTPAQIARFAPLFRPYEFQTDQTIFMQGDRAKSLYVVIEGEAVVIYKPYDGPELVVAKIKPQGVVGWSAALGSPFYTSSVKCLVDCLLLQVDSSDLRNLCSTDAEAGAVILERLAVVIAERLRNTHTHVLALLEQGLNLRMREYVDPERVSTV